MMQCPVFTVDAFTTVPFRGNPASVCLLDHDPLARLDQHTRSYGFRALRAGSARRTETLKHCQSAT